MLLDQHQLLAASAVIGAMLLALWLGGGLALAVLGAALADLGLTLVERRRVRNAARIAIRREES